MFVEIKIKMEEQTMELMVSDVVKEHVVKEKVAYDQETNIRMDVEITLRPLRAMYKVGMEGDETANLFEDLEKAVGKFNALVEAARTLKELKMRPHHCRCCGAYIEKENLKVCDKCASEFQF